MRFAVSVLFKGLLYTVCFILIASSVLYLLGVKTEFYWAAGEDGSKIISAASDGSGNIRFSIGGKSVQIRRGDVRSLRDRLMQTLK